MAKKSFVVLLALFFSPAGLCLAQFTVINGSINTLSCWDGTTVEGRASQVFQGTVVYQAAINSPNDEDTGSGSALFTGDALFCSLTQQLGINAEGQTLTIYADIAWDGDWDYIYFGFYEEGVNDRMLDASIDITLEVPADTDGTLDDFHTVMATGPLTTTGNPVRVFFGSSCTPYTGGPITFGTSSFAVDRVSTTPPGPTPTPTPIPASAINWFFYE